MMPRLMYFSCPSSQIKSKGSCFLSSQNGIRIQNLGVFLVTGVWLLQCHSVGRAGGGEERESLPFIHRGNIPSILSLHLHSDLA